MVLCINVMVCWDVMSHSLAGGDQCFGGIFSSILNTETADSSEKFCVMWQTA